MNCAASKVVVVTWAGRFMLKAVLQLELGVRGETVSNRSVDAGKILAPAKIAPSPIVDGSKDLLVPAQRTEKLRREFIFRLKIIGERVRVTDPRNFETRFVNFRPQLQVMPGKAGVLPENKFPVITKVAARRQGLFGFAAADRRRPPWTRQNSKFDSAESRGEHRSSDDSNPISVTFHDSGREESEEFFISAA